MNKTIEQNALKFIDENHLIEKGDKILAAFSGGADSVFLLSFLLKYKKRFGIELLAFHLNHKLRDKTAEADEKFCKEFCSERKIKFISISKEVKSFAVKNKISVEEAGRNIRYSEFEKAAEENRCNKIATAHNSSDNVETILLNFFKGTGLKGMAGIPVRRGNIIRPILSLNSEVIRKYLRQNKIPFRIDESNLSSDYERNFLRNEIIPKLKERLSPRLEEKISNISKIIKEINSFVEKQIEVICGKAVVIEHDKLKINTKEITKLDNSLLSIFLKEVIEDKLGIELSSENIFSLIDLMKLQTGKEIHLKENILASRERNELVIGIKKTVSEKEAEQNIKVGETVEVGGKKISIKQISRKNIKLTSDKSTEIISGDSVIKEFQIRKWRNGDRFYPIGLKGSKKISDFLADIKIPSYKKHEQLVLSSSDKIVWVIGHRLDERFKVKPGTKNILKLTVKKS
jgi:tRNA(Ile)-lysidine synthase